MPQCELLKIKKIEEDMFKYLNFVQGLRATEDK